MSSTFPALDRPNLTVDADTDGLALTLRFTGNADMSVVEPLDEYLVAVHFEATRQRLESVTVDFRKLEFMNSSCFKCFVSWLGKVQDMPVPERYKIVFGSNRELHWQRRSLNALRCFAMDVVSIAS
jgi:hypothetical protein